MTRQDSSKLAVQAALLLATFLIAPGSAPAQTQPTLPVIDGQEALALVNGEPITADDFFRNLVSLHDSVEAPGSRPQQDPSELLNRLINIRLILQESRNIGLDELPRVRQAVEEYREDALKELLFRRRAETIGDVNMGDVQARYEDKVRELRVRSVVVSQREDATEFAGKVREGADFDSLAGELVVAKTGETGNDEEFLPASKMLPAVRDAIAGMGIGDVSGPIPVGEEFAVIQLLEVRYPENPEIRRQLEQEDLRRTRADALREYAEALREKHTKINQELFDALDFEAKEPGFDALAEDERVLAEVDGEPPVLVKELTDLLRQDFFHGIEGAIESKKINLRKTPQLYRILQKRAVLLEARRLGLEQTEEYATLVDEFENRLLFSIFLQKIVEPEIRINRQELLDHAAANVEEFSSPEMMRIEALAFGSREPAEATLERLREGADYGWVQANAAGQLVAEVHPSLIQFPRTLIVTSLLPESVREAVAGSTSGDFRLYALPDQPAYYVLRIREVVPPVAQPFEAIEQTVVKRVYAEKRRAVTEEWFRLLRAASDVEIFGTPEALDRMLRGMVPDRT